MIIKSDALPEAWAWNTVWATAGNAIPNLQNQKVENHRTLLNVYNLFITVTVGSDRFQSSFNYFYFIM